MLTSDRLKGFLQIYQLQTENDEEETWRDLVRGSPLWRDGPTEGSM